MTNIRNKEIIITPHSLEHIEFYFKKIPKKLDFFFNSGKKFTAENSRNKSTFIHFINKKSNSTARIYRPKNIVEIKKPLTKKLHQQFEFFINFFLLFVVDHHCQLKLSIENVRCHRCNECQIINDYAINIF